MGKLQLRGGGGESGPFVVEPMLGGCVEVELDEGEVLAPKRSELARCGERLELDVMAGEEDFDVSPVAAMEAIFELRQVSGAVHARRDDVDGRLARALAAAEGVRLPPKQRPRAVLVVVRPRVGADGRDGEDGRAEEAQQEEGGVH
jgi:hypothetical protein